MRRNDRDSTISALTVVKKCELESATCCLRRFINQSIRRCTRFPAPLATDEDIYVDLKSFKSFAVFGNDLIKYLKKY